LRIAVGGFQHETNSFAPSRATYADFVAAKGWPGLCRGDALFDTVMDRTLPIAGFMREALKRRASLIPLLWTVTSPSGPVTSDAFERISAQLINDLITQGQIDAVFLDLHGAMVTEHFPDGEGELLRRVRAVIGPNALLVGSLDLHANVTKLMVEQADFLTAFRTYPHVDMLETGARTAKRLLEARGWGGKALRACPYLIPITAQCSFAEPTAGLYRLLEQIEADTGADLSFSPGFALSDSPETGATILAYAPTQAEADAAVDLLFAALLDAESAYAGAGLWSIEAALDETERLLAQGGLSGPIILADTQDNPGGGGSGDTTGLLRAILARGLAGVTLGLFNDPATAVLAHAAGEGAEIEIALGGTGTPGDTPLQTKARVLRLGPGTFMGTGPMWEGGTLNLGPMALLDVGGVHVAIGSARQQPSTQAIFTHLGVDPKTCPVLVLKSSVHFRADFQPIAGEILVTVAPGLVTADPADLPYRWLRDGVRLRPRKA
jgi:microcystin degradation protein MlrC